MPVNFQKMKGRVKKDVPYYSGLHALRVAGRGEGEYLVLAPDMETLRVVWKRATGLELDEERVSEVGIFQKESITDAI